MDEQIAQFVSITGADSDRAKFFVESANGDVETAIATFFEGDAVQAEDIDDDEMEGQQGESAAAIVASATVEPAAPITGPRTLSGEPAPEAPANWGKQAEKSSSSGTGASGFSASGGRGGGIATLRDIQGNAGGASRPSGARAGGIATFRDLPGNAAGAGAADDDDDDDDEDEKKKPAKFYTGGERSGLNVLNPDRKRKGDAPDVVNSILQKAKEESKRRAQTGTSSSSSSSGGNAAASKPSFTGRGRTINDDTSQDTTPETPSPPDQSSQLPSMPPGGLNSDFLRALRMMPQGPIPGQPEQADADEQVVVRHVVFWQDGFTIAGGPLCRYDDPQHAETLAQLNNNRAPLHLLNIRFGQEVDVKIEKKTNEKYKAPPPPPMKPFEGQGTRLGTPLPAMTGAAPSASASTSATVPMPAASTAVSTPDPSSLTFQVDDNQPTTRIQIRLGDGQKVVAKFNHTHTVADVRQYINASHAGMSARPYTLQASYPPKPLTDEAMSLQEAGLINSVIIQKWS